MPELPEVETVKRGLEKLLVGHTIKAVSSDWQKSFPNSQTEVDQFLVGAKVANVRRRAKVLLVDLDTDYSLVIHLKMTGQLVYVKNKQTEDRRTKIEEKNPQSSILNLQSSEPEARFGAGHPNGSLVGDLPDNSTRVIFYLDANTNNGLVANARKNRSTEQNVARLRSVSTADSDEAVGQERWRSFGLRPKAGQSGPCLYFNDQRKFGWVKLYPTIEVPNIDFMKKVGPEPLDPSFTADAFAERIQKRANTTIKAALLDQTVLAGVGNIYADESLWGAQIHPATRVKDVPEKKLKKLFKELIFVLELSIEKGGSTDKNYVNAEGKKGSYIDFARVFRKEGTPCPRHPGTLIEKIRVAGRGTHVCPLCQKL